MLHILTDEQIDQRAVVVTKQQCRRIQIVTLFEWRDGYFIGSSDEEILKEAASQSMTLITFDMKTISPLLRVWGERRVDHGGVVFIDSRSFAQDDISGISKALVELWEIQGKQDWKNRCFFLTSRR